MTWADEDKRDKRDLLRFAIAGKGEEWVRLQGRIYAIVDVIARGFRTIPLVKTAPRSKGSAEALKDLTSLAANWARAKIERPSLENEKLRAEIASEFAEAKRRWAEAIKIEAETRQIESGTNNQELVASLDDLERLLRIAGVMSHVTFTRVEGDAHLLIGPMPDQVGEPNGDMAALGDHHSEDIPRVDG